MVDGIYRLTQSGLTEPTNIGSSEYVSVDELVQIVAEVAGKRIGIVHIDGPVGVQSRNFSNGRIYSTGWRDLISLRDGIERTYPWVEAQVQAAQADQAPAAALGV
jgi:nucleoside-diphosphate-sugar epimerase